MGKSKAGGKSDGIFSMFSVIRWEKQARRKKRWRFSMFPVIRRGKARPEEIAKVFFCASCNSAGKSKAGGNSQGVFLCFLQFGGKKQGRRKRQKRFSMLPAIRWEKARPEEIAKVFFYASCYPVGKS
ncbi:hypothetical protein [Chitinophaga dinghuensis]|uniref:hypothetical protein n=1 Tax=Chitinophaga dinghuensis TaxID=1539050 RepID=UPI0011B946D0|nr:hypothetical protein [Chitinophaga dinghuensis]